jgi:hypothetical protein
LAKKSSDRAGRAVSAAATVCALGDASLAVLPFDRELANWQGKIAVAAKEGNGLDSFRAALNWAKQDVPPDTGLCEKAKQEIFGTAERHLADVYGVDILDAIYFCVFPQDAASNDECDADVLSTDRSSETAAEIRRLAGLSVIEYERQRKASAEKLGITRITALDNTVKAARAENGDTKGQGRPLELPVIEPWPEPVNGADLLDSICNSVKRLLGY